MTTNLKNIKDRLFCQNEMLDKLFLLQLKQVVSDNWLQVCMVVKAKMIFGTTWQTV
jgi:hypothetical protein